MNQKTLCGEYTHENGYYPENIFTHGDITINEKNNTMMFSSESAKSLNTEVVCKNCIGTEAFFK